MQILIKSAPKLVHFYKPVTTSSVSDFQIGDYTFEVGGRKKGRKQIEELKNGIVVKDDIEYGAKGVVPLWAFGLMY